MERDIQSASNKPEPQRSEALRTIKLKVMEDLRSDLSRYRAHASDEIIVPKTIRNLSKSRCPAQ